MNVEDQKNRLLSWYAVMKDQDFEKADKMKLEITNEEQKFSDFDLKALYKLMVARYHLMYKELEKFSSAIAEVDPDEDNEQYWLNYFYSLFRGIYHFERREYRLALDFYNKARMLNHNIGLIESAELYYRIGVCCHRIYRVTLSIHYFTKAKEIYKKESDFKKLAFCENGLGINSKDIFQYADAEKHYHQALIFVEKSNDAYLKPIVLNNIGVFYTHQSKPKLAIDYLKQAQIHLKNYHDRVFQCKIQYLLARNYFAIDEVETAKNLLESGIQFTKDNSNDLYYYYRFSLLKAKFVSPANFKESYQEAISYFKRIGEWELVIEYGEELAHYFGGIEQYKEAYEYLRLATESRYTMNKERALHGEESIA
ncbi:MAG TPA: hypothetical protein VFK44_06125 [Bacillales bacterium]|nr:hypothetical protein [Bacillales bacterium]